ncbi:MAG TPA: PfkB family carbohydrate kinase [Lacipirellulaceae bacterium]|nr:PfkB family carbohydrate kinase [Lacipirellulaceae bacterium]
MAKRCIVGIGEVLWDVFPDGPRFGGAPANFACSAAELAGERIDVFMVGAVGSDDLGRQAVDSLCAHGVDPSYIAVVEQPTGQVLVKFDAVGHPSYEIATDTAWDNVPLSDALLQLAGRADAVCFGTLAQRSDTTRRTMHAFLRATPAWCLRVLDLNLRPPFWSETAAIESLNFANVLKLNDVELGSLAELLKWKGTQGELLRQLMHQFSLQLVALTRGDRGALVMASSGESSDSPGEPAAVVDTVGAGDAFTAALVVGLLAGLPLAAINTWANRVAAFVCSQPGATPTFPAELRLEHSSR